MNTFEYNIELNFIPGRVIPRKISKYIF